MTSIADEEVLQVSGTMQTGRGVRRRLPHDYHARTERDVHRRLPHDYQACSPFRVPPVRIDLFCVQLVYISISTGHAFLQPVYWFASLRFFIVAGCKAS